MNGSINKLILPDSCFWFGLYHSKDTHHEKCKEIWESIQRYNILLPWPILYEFLNTRFVKQPSWVEKFNKARKRLAIKYINDQPYRREALEATIYSSIFKKRNINFVDMLIRFILNDVNLKIHFLVTFNEKDFMDVCQERRIEIYYG